ncbi:hypothetical protein [Anaerobacillus sp. 1_MG-2023]|uniref:hypothetical protein n=1 Tax=Anaerobacillus sp. 1_MG-2023 TaxID=3062655 RepID=UPI0026E22D9C|nr:hypothetical protein [Anaerobacillus sp. 1_MG-2023]MDO6658677.1 hypothetical protein [Anaerobacillus sp. 1_MG-2023]
MSDLRVELQNSLNDIITSKEITDYTSAVNKFREVFEYLTDIPKKDASVVRVEDKVNKFYFYAYKFALCLIDKGDCVDVIARNELAPTVKISQDLLGEIKFENDGFSYFNYANSQVPHLLKEEIMKELFETAYKPLLENYRKTQIPRLSRE